LKKEPENFLNKVHDIFCQRSQHQKDNGFTTNTFITS